MTPERRKEISSMGGKKAHELGVAHEFNKEEAVIAGAIGGQNAFKKLGREHFREMGKKGGEKVSVNREYMREIGRKGGFAVAKNHDHMVEIGRKGGRKSKKTETVENAETACAS